MPLFKTIRNALSLPADSTAQPSGWLQRLVALSQTASGVIINEYNALTVSDVYKCNRVICEGVAMLPFKLYRKQERGRKEATNHPAYFIVHDEPNEHMTAFTFFEFLVSCLVLWGKFYGYIERDSFGRLVAIWPIRPNACRFEVRDGQMWFFARTYQGVEVKFWDDEVLYIPMLTRDGYNAYSPIELHREALGLSKATEVFGAKFFGSGAHAGGFLQHPGQVGKEAAARLKEQFEAKHSGLDNAHRLAVLEEGMTFQANTIPPEQAQFLQTRQFQRSEIAGIFRVPPHKIGDLTRSTNNNIEQQALEFLTDTLAPILERIEQAFNRKVLLPSEKGRYYFEFTIEGMLRGDTAARTVHNQAMRNVGVYSTNDIRQTMNLDPVEGGDIYLVPLNMQSLANAAQDPEDAAELDPNGEPVQRIRKANLRFFRDVAGRVVNRKASEREKYAQVAFLQPVLSVMECVFGGVSESSKVFAETFAKTIAAKSEGWTVEGVDAVATEELNRCLEAVILRGKE